MSLFENIDKLITERGSAAILRERLALADDKFTALESKAVAFENKVAELESENCRLRLDLEQQKKEREALQPVGPKGDKCPYCQQEKGVLKSLDPHPQSLLRQTGHKIAKYECAGCGQTYDRQVRH